MIADILLRRIEEAQTALAKSSLSAPQGRDAFEYGRAAGVYAGLEHAKEIIVELLAENDRRDMFL